MRKIIPFILIFLFYTLFLGSYGLLDPDEPRYATTSKNMISTGQYILPEFNGKPRINKPPLTYWLISLSYKLFGINEFSSRLPHAILGFLLSIILFFFTKDLTSPLILTSIPLYLFMARLCNTDMILNFFFSSSLLLFFKYYDTKKSKFLIISVISYLFANLTKGPVAYISILIIFIFLIFEKDFTIFKNYFLIIAVLLASISPLLWLIIAVSKLGDFSCIKSILFNETLGRMFKGYGHRENFLFYFKYFPLVFFPWSVLFVLKIKKISALWNDKFLKFNIIWFFTVFIFFSIAKSKLISYILILSVPFSVILSKFVENLEILNKKLLVTIFLFFFPSLIIYLVTIKEFKLNFLILPYFILTGFLLVKSENLPLAIISFLTGIFLFAGQFITDLKSEKFLENLKIKNGKIVVFRKRFTGTAFYLGNYLKVDTKDELKKIKKFPIYLITTKKNLNFYLKNINYKIVKETKGRIFIKIENVNCIR